ncbi:MAG: SoxR reducing system RseC family protein [Gammaproteobacteria bacterium]|nr:SoxR reducing system RseC family protein [Gammaproteobacteria bacterium]
MDSPRGRVLSIHCDAEVRRAEVEVTSAQRCARCASGKGCGAGLVGNDGRLRRVSALVPAGCELAIGDEVRIELAPDSLLGAALIAYGLPLAGAVVGAGAGYLAGLEDVAAATTALAGLAVGVFIGRARLRRGRSRRCFRPTIVARR